MIAKQIKIGTAHFKDIFGAAKNFFKDFLDYGTHNLFIIDNRIRADTLIITHLFPVQPFNF